MARTSHSCWPPLPLEHLTTDDSGLLAFGIEQRGGIFVEKGRVCWIAASGLGRRLRDLILIHSQIDEAAPERVCEQCRVNGGMVGQTLVAEEPSLRENLSLHAH